MTHAGLAGKGVGPLLSMACVVFDRPSRGAGGSAETVIRGSSLLHCSILKDYSCGQPMPHRTVVMC